MAYLEIERKFLVKGDYKSLAYDVTRIRQGYIASGNGRTVRVRIRGDKGYLTIKGPSDRRGLGRFEWEKEISVAEAEALLTVAEPGVISKSRYHFQVALFGACAGWPCVGGGRVLRR